VSPRCTSRRRRRRLGSQESEIRHLLVTDYTWDSLDVGRDVLARAGAEVLTAMTGEEDQPIGLAYPS
jgi:hypothetical protein